MILKIAKSKKKTIESSMDFRTYLNPKEKNKKES